MFLLLVFPKLSASQDLHFNGTVYSSSIINSGKQTPFWFWANQLGQIQQTSGFLQTGVVGLSSHYSFKGGQSIFVGTQIAGSIGEKDNLTTTELYGGFRLGKIIMKAGSWAETIVQSGLSSSNGNLLNSRNARPYPRVGIESNGYVKIGKRNFSIAGCWEEGILYDERVVERPRLHHKNLFLRWGKAEKLQFTFGIDHYAFWGGTTAESGQQPIGFGDYVRTVFAMKGGKNATLSDQINVAGNSLGQYFFIFRKDWKRLNAEVRIIHPFEDKSGMILFNGMDNLYSFYLTFKKPGLVNHTLVEFLYTMNQSGENKPAPDGHYVDFHGQDNYLNHGFYRSGFTYYGMVMGSPFFYPVYFDNNGVSLGIANNRIVAFHFGADGVLSESFSWKGLASCSFNHGTYNSPFKPVRKQISGLVEVKYDSLKFPVYVKAGFAFDYGSNLNEGVTKGNFGFQLVVGKAF